MDPGICFLSDIFETQGRTAGIISIGAYKLDSTIRGNHIYKTE